MKTVTELQEDCIKYICVFVSEHENEHLSSRKPQSILRKKLLPFITIPHLPANEICMCNMEIKNEISELTIAKF